MGISIGSWHLYHSICLGKKGERKYPTHILKTNCRWHPKIKKDQRTNNSLRYKKHETKNRSKVLFDGKACVTCLPYCYGCFSNLVPLYYSISYYTSFWAISLHLQTFKNCNQTFYVVSEIYTIKTFECNIMQTTAQLEKSIMNEALILNMIVCRRCWYSMWLVTEGKSYIMKYSNHKIHVFSLKLLSNIDFLYTTYENM